jgi:hypothetical protein
VLGRRRSGVPLRVSGPDSGIQALEIRSYGLEFRRCDAEPGVRVETHVERTPDRERRTRPLAVPVANTVEDGLGRQAQRLVAHEHEAVGPRLVLTDVAFQLHDLRADLLDRCEVADGLVSTWSRGEPGRLVVEEATSAARMDCAVISGERRRCMKRPRETPPQAHAGASHDAATC